MAEKNEMAKAEPKQEVAQKSQDKLATVTQLALDEVHSGGIKLPDGYDAKSAITTAWLHLREMKDDVINKVSLQSISRSFFKMIRFGLDMDKGQGYFIPYGNTLTFRPSYLGDLYRAKRDSKLKEAYASVIWEGEEYDLLVDPKNGRRMVTNHRASLKAQASGKIEGAYAILVFEDGTYYHDLMSFSQIQTAWKQGGSTTVHDKFPEEMAKKTVLRRALKPLIAASEEDELDYTDEVRAEVTAPGKPAIGFEEAHVVEEVKEEPKMPTPAERKAAAQNAKAEIAQLVQSAATPVTAISTLSENDVPF